jgi:hypothetical protein
MASLARSLITKGVGRLIPGVGLILTAVQVANYLKDVDMGETDASKLANYGGQSGRGRREKENKEKFSQEREEIVMADDSRSRGFAAKEQKLQDKLATLQSRYGKAKELLEKEGDADTSRMKGAGRLLSQIDEVKQQLKDLRGSAPKSKPSPSGPFPLEDYGQVRAAPVPLSEREGRELAAREAERRAGSGSSSPSTVDTRSKKPLAKRIMEALGDNRPMAQATSDRKMTEEMEMEREMNVAGRKKGGMAKKKKAPVKKAYGGMVKKKHGGSANKVNMKAGFTRRGCSKG